MSVTKRQKNAQRCGQLKPSGDHYKVRISFVDGSRPWIHLPPGLSEAEAKEKATRLAKKAFEEEWTIDRQGDGISVASWFERYLDWKEEKGQAISAPRSHVRNWIAPALVEKRMEQVTTDDLRNLVVLLDRMVSHDEIRWKTATNIWGTVTKAFKDAAHHKNNELRVLAANPALGVPPPDKGRETAKVHLFPSEFLQLMNCDAVPLFRRRAYAVAIYLYLRPGELEALGWQDFDVEHDLVTIQRSIDRELGGEKAPKSGIARVPMDIEPELLPLVLTMFHESGGKGRVLPGLGDDREYARTLRADLVLAGVMRHELHNQSKDPPREWMTMHDLRTTGITWMAVRGDHLLVIKTRAGHSDSKMTEHYIDQAAVLRKGRYGAPFPPLPVCLLGEHAAGDLDESEAAREGDDGERVLH